jgi:hypothetical protein
MPPIFKALASITAWILFINGCLAMIFSGVDRLVGGPPMGALAAWAVAVTSLALAVVAMRLRKGLE